MINKITELNFPQYATLHEATCKMEDMGEHVITTQVRIGYGIVPDFSQEWAVVYEGAKYVMRNREPQANEENTSTIATVDLTFRHWAEEELKRWYFFTVQPVESGTAIPDKYVASVKLNLHDFLTLFSQVLYYYYGEAITIDLNPEWEYDPEPTGVEISRSYCWDVLLKIYELYGVRWEITPNGDLEHYVIRVGYPSEEIDHIFEYGFKGGLLKVERQPQSEEIRNMLIGRGSTENIPARYFKAVDSQNPNFREDPDWIPELANIYFGELRGATFRSYIQGWKARHYNDGEHGEISVTKSEDAYSPWAWMRGYNDEKFNPVEFTADGFTTAAGGYGVLGGSSIDRYGELMGGLDDNDDYKPTIQGVRSGDHLKFFGTDFGRVDEAVWVEQMTTNNVRDEAPNDAVRTSLSSIQGSRVMAAGSRAELTLQGGWFAVPVGKRGDFEQGVLTLTPNEKVVVENVTVEVTNAAGDAVAATGIATGRWRPRIKLSLHNTGTSSASVTARYSSPTLTTATPDEWKDTFSILVKNLWGTAKQLGETETEYAERVWRPILGDKSGGEAKVVFSDGALASSEDYEFTIVDIPEHIEQSCVWETSTGGITKTHTYTSHWRIKLARSNADYDTLGVMTPGRERNGQAGNHFFFIGIELPHAYVTWAEEGLDDWKQDETNEAGTARSTWVVTPDKIRLGRLQDGESQTLLGQLKAGKSVTLRSHRFISGSEQERLYLQSVTLTYSEPTDNDPFLLPDIAVVLGNDYTVSANPVETVQGEVRAIRNQIGSLSNISQEVRRTGDKTYIRKDTNDRTSHDLTVGGTLKAEKLFDIGDFLAGVRGARLAIDKATGQSFLEVDRIFARVKAYFESLTVVERQALAGEQMITPGGGVTCTSVEAVYADGFTITLSPEDEPADALAEHGALTAYRCYFLSEQDGEKRETKIIADDQAIAQTWNAAEGTTNKVENYRWWRLVTAIDQDAYTDDSGNHFGYIEVSATDYEQGASIPVAGDEIVQFGNRTDASRQAAIVISTVNPSDAPSIKLLTGIGSGTTNAEHYSLNERDEISQGYDKTKGNAYLKVSGDLHVGAKDDSTYIDYDSQTKEFNLHNVTLSVGSKVGNTSLGSLIEGFDASKYLRDALNQTTAIKDGLVLTSAILLGYENQAGERVTMAGHSGLYGNPKSIASFWGGPMVDKFYESNGDKIPANKISILRPSPDGYAASLVRMDGSAYFGSGSSGFENDGSGWLANGNISWDANGAITFGNGIKIDLGGGSETTLGGLNTTLGNLLTLFNQMQNVLVPVDSDGNRVAWDSANLWAIKSVKGFYSDSFISARGLNPNESSGPVGIDETQLAQYLTDHGYVTGTTLNDYALMTTLNSYALKSELSAYALKSDIPSLTDYAQKSWVEAKGYLTAVAWDDVSDKPSWIEASKPSYAFSDLTSHPTTLGGYGISDAKISNGVITLGANTITPLVSADMKSLTFQAGAFGNTAKTYTPTSAQSVNVPTKTSHLNNDSDFTTNALLTAGLATKADKSDFDTFKAWVEEMFDLEDDPASPEGKRIKAKYGLYSPHYISARGVNPNGGGSGGGLIQSVYGWSNLGGTFNDTTLTDTFNAYTINRLYLEKADKSWVEGKGYITSSALTGYAKTTDIQSWVEGKKYLVTHQTIHTLTFKAGTFSAKTFTANSAAAEVNIPTSSDHITEGSGNLFFTDARAQDALSGHTSDTAIHITAAERTAWNAKLDKSVYDTFKSGYDTWKSTIDTWKSTITTWKGTIDTWKNDITAWRNTVNAFMTKFDSMFDKQPDSSLAEGFKIKALFGLYSDQFISARGLNSSGGSGGSGFGLMRDWPSADPGKNTNDALGANLGWWLKENKADVSTVTALTTRVATLEGKNYLNDLTVSTTGTGNAITTVTQSADKKTLTFTKGSFLTSHQPIRTLTIQKNGVNVDTFTPTATADKTINIDNVASASALSGHTGNTTAHITADERTAWNNKVDAVDGKGLSSNDFTDDLLSKLDGIAAGANKYVHPTGGANTTITAGNLKVLSAITVNSLGHVTSVSSKSLAAADIPSLDWSKITSGKPTTLSGYGITDAYTKTDADNRYVNVTGDTMTGLLTLNAGAKIISGQKLVIGDCEITWDATNGGLKFSKGIYSDSFISARGLNSNGGSGGSGFGRLDDWANYNANGTDALSAKLGFGLKTDISGLTTRVATLEGKNYLDSLTVKLEGSGNAITTASQSTDKKTVTLTKGSSFSLTSHNHDSAYSAIGHTHSQYLTAITKQMVENVLTGDITSHTHSAYAASGHSHSNYVTLDTAQTITGVKTFNTIKIANSGNGTARPTTGVAVNGILGTMAANDTWAIFGYGTAGDAGYLEIATGDNGNEPIYVSQYNNANPLSANATRKYGITLMNASGNQVFNDVTATKFIKSGGTSTQFLKADGSVDSNTYLTTGTAASTYLSKTDAASTYMTITATNAALSAYVSKSGDTMSGNLALSYNSANAYDAAKGLSIKNASGDRLFHLGYSTLLCLYSASKIALRPNIDFSNIDVSKGIEINADEVYPSTTNLVSLGTSAKAWKNVYARNYTSDTTTYLSSSASTTSIIFRLGTTEAMRIWQPNGNVGIGNNQPAYKLDVNGTTKTNKLIIGSITLEEVNGNLHIDKGVYSDSFISARGLNSGGSSGGSGFGLMRTWDSAENGNANTELALGANLGWALKNDKADKATTLAGYGITNAYTKTESDAKYLTSLGVGTGNNANNLALVKNGSTSYITVPYATNANRLQNNTDLTYGASGLQWFNISGNAGCVVKVNDTPTAKWWHILRFNHANNAGYYTDLAVPFQANSLYYKRVDNGSLANDHWVKILDDLNYSTVLDNRYLQKTSYTAADVLSKLLTVDGSGSGLDADTLDGVHNGALTAQIWQGQMDTTTDFNTLGGLNEVGKYYYGNSSSTNPNKPFNGAYGLYNFRCGQSWRTNVAFQDNRLWTRWYHGDSGNWGDWKQIAFTTDNVYSATKLATTRTIWGQNFNGEGNVSGALSSVSGISFSNTGSFNLDAYGNFKASTTSNNSWNVQKSDGTNMLQVKCDASAAYINVTNFGVGVTSPTQKLDVLGNQRLASSVSGAGGNVHLELWRGTLASWKLLNTSGVLKFQCNYTDKVGDYFDCLSLNYNTGNATLKGLLNLSNSIVSSLETSTYLAGNQGTAIINSTAGAGKYTMLAKMNSTNGYMTLGTYLKRFELHYTDKATVDAETNSATHNVTLLDEDGLTTLKQLKISNGDAVAHLAFGRGGYNYITAPSTGLLAFVANGKAVTAANADLVIANNSVYPGTTNAVSLGLTNNVWSNVYTRNVKSDSTLYVTSGSTLYLSSAGGSSLIFRNGTSEVMRMNGPNSYIGILTNAPTVPLEVKGVIMGSTLRAKSAVSFHKDSGNSQYFEVDANGQLNFCQQTDSAYKATNAYLTWEGVFWAKTGIWSNGYISARGQNTSSDAALKTAFTPFEMKLEDIASAPSVEFSWRSDGKRDLGSIAQHWQKVNPLLTPVNPDGNLTLQYGKTALLGLISVTKRVMSHEERITELENRNSRLETENRELKRKIEILERR